MPPATEPLGPYDACSPLHRHETWAEPVSSTRENALLWLAGLEKECPDLTTDAGRPRHENPGWTCIVCHNTGMVPVLDLREPCRHHTVQGDFLKVCAKVKCPGWQTKQGHDALHQAMTKAAYSQMHVIVVGEPERHYYWPGERIWKSLDCDSNDYIAAMKAMRAAGYGQPT